MKEKCEYLLIPDDGTPLDERFPIIIPITVIVSAAEKTPKILYYPEFYEYAADFAEKFAKTNHPLSDSALIYLNDLTRDKIEAFGYRTDKRRTKSWMRSFYAKKADEINSAAIKDSTVKLSDEVMTNAEIDPSVKTPENELKYKNLTTVDIDELIENDLTAFVTYDCGKIVSLASVNPYSENGIYELNVQTSPDYRKKGYAASNIAALSREILQNGGKIVYNCSRYNSGSAKTAVKAGLYNYAQSYQLVCYNVAE